MPTPLFAALGGLLLSVLATLGGAQADSRNAVAASGNGVQLRFDELDPVLEDRWAMAPEGRESIQHLTKVRLIEHLADELGLIITDAELGQRWAEVDRAARAQGREGGILEELGLNGIEVSEFRSLLRTSMYHERLTREALQLDADTEVTAEMQEVWIEQQLRAGAFEAPAPPWKDGVAARCGPVQVSAEEFRGLLRTQLPPDNVRELCFQMLLRKGLEEYVGRRIPDLSDKARADAIEREIERRRNDVANDPRYAGVDLDAVLRAQGMRVESLAGDPAVVVASLATLAIDRLWGEDGLRGTYEAERQHFENRYGEAVSTRMLFVAGVPRPNQLQPRTLEEAKSLAASIAAKVDSEASFLELVEEFSDDAPTKANQGFLGWIARETERIPAALREAVFAALASDPTVPRLVGPVELSTPSGACLLWLSQRRPSPGWQSMRVHVHRELRSRLIEEIMPRRGVVTFLDPQ